MCDSMSVYEGVSQCDSMSFYEGVSQCDSMSVYEGVSQCSVTVSSLSCVPVDPTEDPGIARVCRTVGHTVSPVLGQAVLLGHCSQAGPYHGHLVQEVRSGGREQEQGVRRSAARAGVRSRRSERQD